MNYRTNPGLALEYLSRRLENLYQRLLNRSYLAYGLIIGVFLALGLATVNNNGINAFEVISNSFFTLFHYLLKWKTCAILNELYSS
jgi:hypothetical protein